MKLSPEAKKVLGRLNRVHREICELASGKRKWTMCVPVQPDDSDMVLQSAVDIAEALLKENAKLKEALSFYADGNTWYRPASCERDQKRNYNCSRRPEDTEDKGVGPDGLAGKIARQALASNAETMKRLSEGGDGEW